MGPEVSEERVKEMCRAILAKPEEFWKSTASKFRALADAIEAVPCVSGMQKVHRAFDAARHFRSLSVLGLEMFGIQATIGDHGNTFSIDAKYEDGTEALSGAMVVGKPENP